MREGDRPAPPRRRADRSADPRAGGAGATGRAGATGAPPAAALAGALLLAAAASLPAPAGAQEDGGETDSLPPPGFPDSIATEVGGLEVETSRPTLTGGGATGIRTEMDSVDAGPSPTLADVLRDVPLIRVRRNSRGQVQPSLRGMEERQIAVLVDEVPLTVGWDNRTDLSVVPMTAVNQIDMVRGLSSVLAGPNALGGIVKIGIGQGRFPERVDDPLDLRTSVDQTGAFAVSGQVDHLVDSDGGRLWIKYGGGYRDRDAHAAPGDLGGPGVDGGRLVNTDMQLANGFASARYQADGGAWASLSSAGYWTERGVLPELHLLDPGEPAARLWRYPDQWQSLTSLSVGTGWRETPLGRGDLEASVGLDVRHQEIDAFGSLAFADSVGGETGDDRTVSVRLVGDHELGAGTLSTAFTWAETRHEEVLSAEPGDRREYVQRLWSLGLEATQPLAPDGGGWISEPRVTVGASYDASSTPETGNAPARPGIDGWGVRAGAEATVGGGDGTIHGGVSRKVRFPALRELFSGALGRFEPNPDLGPLTLKVGELGTTLHPAPDLELQGTVFQQRLQGAVVRAVLPDGRFQRQNRGETRATGFELAGNWRRGDVSLRADLTLQSVALLDEDGDSVPGERAEYQPEVAANLHARVPVALGLRARGGVEVTGTQFGADPRTGGFEEIDPSAHVTLGLSRKIGRGFAGLPPLRASLTAENLGDAVVFDQLGLPRPGRTIRFQLEMR